MCFLLFISLHFTKKKVTIGRLKKKVSLICAVYLFHLHEHLNEEMKCNIAPFLLTVQCLGLKTGKFYRLQYSIQVLLLKA